jgi:hypothetical protein
LWLSSPFCPALAVLLLAVLSWQPCPDSPVLVAMSGQSWPSSPVLASLSRQPCPGSYARAVLA